MDTISYIGTDNLFYIVVVVIILFIVLFTIDFDETFQNNCKIPKNSIDGTANAYTGLMCIDDTLPLIKLSDDLSTFSCISKDNTNCLMKSDFAVPSTVQCKDPNISKFKDWMPNTQYNIDDTVYYNYKTYADDINTQIMNTQMQINANASKIQNDIVTQQNVLTTLQTKLQNKTFDPLSQTDLNIKLDLNTNQIPNIITNLAIAKNAYAKNPENNVLKNTYNTLAKSLSQTQAKSNGITPLNILNKQINDQKIVVANLNNLLKYPDPNVHPNQNDLGNLKTKLNQLPIPNNFVCIKAHISPSSFGSSFDPTLWKVSINVNNWLSGPGLRDINSPTRLIFNDLSSNGYYTHECSVLALNDTNHWCNKIYNSYQNYCSKSQTSQLGGNRVPGCDNNSKPGPLTLFKSSTSTSTIPLIKTFYGKLPQSVIDINTQNGTPDAYTVNTCLRQCTVDPLYKNIIDACKTSCLCCGLKTNCPASSINSGSGCCAQANLAAP